MAKKVEAEEVKSEVATEVAVKAPRKSATKKVVEDNVAEEVKTPKAPRKTTAKKAVSEEVKTETTVEEKAPKKAVKKIAKDKTIQFWGTGRRKKSVARVRIMQGNGKFIINGRDIDEYFGLENLKIVAKQPLTLTDSAEKFDVYVNVYGGGFTGQCGAIRMGLARAIEKFDANLRPMLKKAGYLTRDARIKERKKYGLLKARKDQPFVKR